MADFTNQQGGWSPRGQVKWHISLDMAKYISDLIKKAGMFYMNGDIGRWYWTLSTIRENINHDLKKTEMDLLDGLEEQCNSYHSKWDAYKYSIEIGIENKSLRPSKSKFAGYVRQYSREVLKLLKAMGYFPDKDDRTKMSF